MMRSIFAAWALVLVGACATPAVDVPPDVMGEADGLAESYAEAIEATFVELTGLPDVEAREVLRVNFTEVMQPQLQWTFPLVSREKFAAQAGELMRGAKDTSPNIEPEVLAALAVDGFAVERDPTVGQPKPIVQFVEGDGLQALQYSVFGTWEPGQTPPLVAVEFDPAGQPFPILKFRALLSNKVWLEAREALADKTLQASPLTLDLRGNRGGMFNMVTEVAGLGLEPDRMVVSLETVSGIGLEQKSAEDGIKFSLIFVLIDEQTNSGALALTAALQDQAGAVVIGTPGPWVSASVSTVVPVYNPNIWSFCGSDPCFLNLPTHQMLRPTGRPLSEGVVVDVEVDPRDEEAVVQAIRSEAARRGY